ncbi:MAG: LPS export ABC transporter periplasmic protein LptC [Deltaproteobacteria bacterium]|nr:LPS export ABC transporter periplasmic protein LptC [Deltaproteobacteria bacterium]MBW2658395.1 LPS export ABC transporter periplasmic protein LptC [Deltaproteobacteria bacterium]
MKLHRNTIWLVPLILIITFPLWRIPVGAFLTPRGGFNPEIANGGGEPASQNFSMKKITILQNQKGKDTALIRAESARTAGHSKVFVLRKVDADLFDAAGNITHVVSNTGEYNVTTKVLTLIDDVVVNKTRDKQFLYTDLLYYDGDKRTVRCPGKTRLVSQNATIDGGSLDYDIEAARYDIGGRVHVTLDGFSVPAGSPAP